MSTDDIRVPGADEPHESTDAAVAGAAAERDDAASDGVRAALDDIEAQPLAERAPGYAQLAERLRTQLEESDPARGTNGR